MSLNRKTTSFITVTNILIVLLIAFICLITLNPLAILGLFFLQNMPVYQERMMEDGEDDDEGKAYQNSEIGFTTK